MAFRNRFTRIDAFTKTVEDARVRTTSGGIITLSSILIILWLIWGEWGEYRNILQRSELIVDKSRGEKMEIRMNVTFPRMPCELLTLDVMDVSGAVQSGVMHGISKVRLGPEAEGGRELEIKTLDLHKDEAVHLAADYCGECYGAAAPPTAKKPGCCNDCDEVREAYAALSWSFGHGENVEQCKREHYAERLEAQRKEGCRIQGTIRVNKVVGNFHFAPGKSFNNGNVHVHDLDNYYKDDYSHSFTHKIHLLSFSPPILPTVSSSLANSQLLQSHYVDPLDDTEQHTDNRYYNYMYYVKVVSTAYLPLGWEKHKGKSVDTGHHTTPHEYFELGMLGTVGDHGSIETNQYSVTSHKRSIHGGDDSEAGHKERLHARGGIPGVFFSYDISPMKVINREVRSKSFAGFLVGVCAVIGGTLTVAAAIDRALYEGERTVKKLHQG